MNTFKTTLITCQQCGRRIMVRAADAERGTIACSHIGCGIVNNLRTDFHYDEAVVNGLPSFGSLTYLENPETKFDLRFGPNVIGTGNLCTVRIDRFEHDGRCFISRQHCTLTVTFDKWTGKLRYHIQDGALDADTQSMRYSLNGTMRNGTPLLKTEIIDVSDGDIITLGGADRFRLTTATIPLPTLATYKVDLAFNPDRTQ
ncbi:FHA domain-containing protein [Spirosoma rigui]|uniref:FHA domain-containing protein n=1 Tax=Spirosoma rigui TaxID=564064 RepID=UPI0009B16B49|nr:FHA domain-containing protein [Spirosoma rigui]